MQLKALAHVAISRSSAFSNFNRCSIESGEKRPLPNLCSEFFIRADSSAARVEFGAFWCLAVNVDTDSGTPICAA